MQPQPWILEVLATCASKCLDTEEERLEVAMAIQRHMVAGDSPENDISTRDLAERMVQGRSVSTQGQREVGRYLLGLVGTRKE